MPVRTFTDRSGATWEVFEVQRSSSRPGAVSAGHEQGWLAFMSGLSKRRLAPYPAEWADASDETLEQLCASARNAPAARYPQEFASGEFPVVSEMGLRQSGAMRMVNETDAPPQPVAFDDPMEQTVRSFAHQARVTGLPAIEAMVQLKGLLLAELGENASIDLHRVRRWFVEAYYFERGA